MADKGRSVELCALHGKPLEYSGVFCDDAPEDLYNARPEELCRADPGPVKSPPSSWRSGEDDVHGGRN